MSIDYNALSSILGFASVAVAIIALWLQTRRSQLISQADILLRLDERFCSSEMRVMRGKAARKLLKGTSDNNELGDILDFFTNIAYMVNRGALDTELAYAPFGYWFVRYWQVAQKYVSEQRRFDPDTWATLEGFVKRIIERKKNQAEMYLSEEALESFLLEESQYGTRLRQTPATRAPRAGSRG